MQRYRMYNNQQTAPSPFQWFVMTSSTLCHAVSGLMSSQKKWSARTPRLLFRPIATRIVRGILSPSRYHRSLMNQTGFRCAGTIHAEWLVPWTSVEFLKMSIAYVWGPFKLTDNTKSPNPLSSSFSPYRSSYIRVPLYRVSKKFLSAFIANGKKKLALNYARLLWVKIWVY